MNHNEFIDHTVSPDIRPITPQLVVEHEGRRLAVVAFTDLDGTAIDETIPEAERGATIGPARETIVALENQGITSGVNTGRSFGEANDFEHKLGGHGIAIAEDGAVVGLPSHIRPEVARSLGAVEHGGRFVVVLSRATRSSLTELVDVAEDEMRKQGLLNGSLISTFHSDAATIRKAVGHPTDHAAALAADRLASGFVAGLTRQEEEVIKRIATERDVRTFATPLHLIGNDAHKGHALSYVNSFADRFFPGMNVQGILPIAFGNNVNDITFMKKCREINGGIGIMVAKPGGGYFVHESEIPDYVIKTSRPFGYGMKEAVPDIYRQLNQRFNLNLK